MKVMIKELRPNPFRNMGEYPINKEKVSLLVSSISETSFWDNILARKNNGCIEIAYGHHRVMALLEEESGYGKDAIINIPVRDLSDEQMIRIMANENMSEFSPEPRIINETIRVVRDFLLKNKEKVCTLIAKGAKPRDISRVKNSLDRGEIGVEIIARFLGKGWSLSKVSNALREIKLTEEKHEKTGEPILSKDAIDMLPDQDKSSKFTRIIDNSKSEGITIPKQEQIAVARTIKNRDIKSREIEDAFERKSPTYRGIKAERGLALRRREKTKEEEIEKIHKLTSDFERLRGRLIHSKELIEKLNGERWVSGLKITLGMVQKTINEIL